MDAIAAQAMIRFGLGRSASEPIPTDPLASLEAQVRSPDPAQFAGLPSCAQALAVFRNVLLERRADPNARPKDVQLLTHADAAMQLANAVDTAAGFRERLVWFWTNHFTVSLRKGNEILVTVGPFVREAIRPNVTGRFVDMLFAVMRHPAMLVYLDNATSFGPNSFAGQRQNSGLNENLARECLELHTVSTAAGYTQKDVTEFAKILTGWSVQRQSEPMGFLFRPKAHEPGPKTLMGREFPPGEEGGVMALRYLAEHPATHRHLATKLVAHFVADDPPPDAVRRIEGVLRDSGGDLGAAAVAVTKLPAAWRPFTKLRTPQEYVVACVRALGLPPASRPDLIGVLASLGQPLWRAPLPNGWPDRAGDWSGSADLLRRIDWAFSLAERAGDADPMALGDACLGSLLTPAARGAMQHAGSRRDALTLLLASPEFLRR